MTDAERLAINERIALKLGWKRATEPLPGGWIQPEGVDFGWVQNLPDFTREWKHAGPLFIELINKQNGIIQAAIIIERALNRILEQYDNRGEEYPNNTDVLIIEAVAIAWTWENAWKEEK